MATSPATTNSATLVENASETLPDVPELAEIVSECEKSAIGKHLPTALYIHRSALSALSLLLQRYEQLARRHLPPELNANIIKLNFDKLKVSYLFYPDFDSDPHPALHASWQVDVATGNSSYRQYNPNDNPPILHRKETFVTRDYPQYEVFARLTRQEQRWGLLNGSQLIGTLQGWQDCLKKTGVDIQDHQVVKRNDGLIPKIERHKAAIVRQSLSRPVRLALEAGLFPAPETSFFDYGCGYGGDMTRMAEKGYPSAGYDPYYYPENPKIASDVVNLGYVINVIECPTERREALIKAWELTQKVLIVSSLMLVDHQGKEMVAYGDGIITRRNTFQKYYEQEELKAYIDQVLNINAIPVALGIYLVFKDAAQAEAFQASRVRSRTTTPRIRANIKRFEDYQELLTPLIQFVAERGRLPVTIEEFPEWGEIKQEFGSMRRAFQTVLQATSEEEWEDVASQRRADLLVYLALSQFGRRLDPKILSLEVRNDIKGLFGSYQRAETLAARMLYSLGDKPLITFMCQASAIGRRTEHALYIHISLLSELSPLLRLYEGCANRTVGRMDGATVVKFHIKSPKITYLYYPDFDADPHPILHTSMEVDLRDLHVTYQDYKPDENPPILYYKDELVTPDYPGYEKFNRLTKQEEDWGLLDDLGKIKRQLGWQKCLAEHCAELRNYRLYWRKDADPYKVKLLKSAQHQRKRERAKLEAEEREDLLNSDSLENCDRTED